MKKFILMFLALAGTAAVSCQKLPTVVDADGEFLVSTSYDQETDFSKYSTFTVADSVLVLDSYFRCDTVKNSFTDKLVEKFRQKMESRGYTYVPADEVRDGNSAADLALQMTYVGDTDYYVDYVDPYWWLDYPGYWSSYYWGSWGGGWYYPYPVVYQFSTHSLMVDMADLTSSEGEDARLPVVWSCMINGEAGYANVDYRRFMIAIDQAFTQSEYIGKDAN